MAIGQGSSSGATRRGRRFKRKSQLTEINVTPLVDVMLVLLIIFMISAPLLNSGIKVTLPKTEAAALKDTGDPLTVTIDSKGALFVNDEAADETQLIPRLKAMAGPDTEKPVFVRAAADVPYEVVAKVMAKLSSSGFLKINLVTDTLAKSPKAPASEGVAQGEG